MAIGAQSARVAADGGDSVIRGRRCSGTATPTCAKRNREKERKKERERERENERMRGRENEKEKRAKFPPHLLALTQTHL